MQVAFRVDASLSIGTGHVMRCLALADALEGQGGECAFICREHTGNLIEHIHNKGYCVHAFPVSDREAGMLSGGAKQLVRAHWLGASWQQDVEDCCSIVAELRPDWLIVDHYAVDARWELAIKPHCSKLMVIDDLADRAHACDVLLDQTFGRNPADYEPRVPAECILLCGSQYALLRPDFAALRPYSLERRKIPQLHRLLITMGGVDKENITGQVLEALKHCELPADCHITVVMGVSAPWIAEVRHLAEQMPCPTEVLINTDNMAQLMADSDLAIGAAGATSWERCCLGLPTIMLALADNQKKVASGLESAGAVQLLRDSREISDRLPLLLNGLSLSPSRMASICQAAARITDGHGVVAVIHRLESLS